MKYGFKGLGLALLAALALVAVVSSSASAANYTASKYPETMRSSSPAWNVTLKTEAGNVECAENLEGTISASSTDLTVSPNYWGCSAFGFLEATVTGCKYTFTEPTGFTDNYSAKMDIVSPCTIKASTCHVTIGNQGALSGVAFTNETAGGDVAIKANVTGIAYTVVADGFLCPFNGTGSKTGGSYVHDVSVTFAPLFGGKFDVG